MSSSTSSEFTPMCVSRVSMYLNIKWVWVRVQPFWLSLWPSQKQETGHQELFLMLTILIIQSVDLWKDLCYFVTSIQWVLQILWGGVDESTVLMVDQVAQAVIVLGLQAGQVHHFVTDIRWVDVLLQASQTTSGVRANVVLVWASSCCSNDLFYYMYEWLPVCMFVQYP